MKTVGSHDDDDEQFEIVKAIAELLRPESVLEIGCGYRRFRPLFENYIGVDKNPDVKPDMIKDVSKLNMENMVFDMTLSCTCMMHINDVSETLKEISRITKRYVLLIESVKWIGKAKPHKYEFDGFRKVFELGLITRGSPLRVWLFERVP